MGVSIQKDPNELDVVVNSVGVPAVIVSNVVSVEEHVGSPMKPSVCTVDFLSAAGTDILPVCAVSPSEIELEPTLGLAELFWSTNFIDASVPPRGSVAHADARPVESLPTDVTVRHLSTSEVKLVSEEDFFLRAG